MVEDDPTFRQVVESILGQAGYREVEPRAVVALVLGAAVVASRPELEVVPAAAGLLHGLDGGEAALDHGVDPRDHPVTLEK